MGPGNAMVLDASVLLVLKDSNDNCVALSFTANGETPAEQVPLMKSNFDDIADNLIGSEILDKTKANERLDKALKNAKTRFKKAAIAAKKLLAENEGKDCQFNNSERASEAERMKENCSPLATIANKLENLAYMYLNCRNGKQPKRIAKKTKYIKKLLAKNCNE